MYHRCYQGGDRYNVGCGDVYLEGTCRTYEPAKRDYIERRLGESLQALDMLLKTESTLDYKRGHGATINDPEAIDYATSIVENILGKRRWYILNFRPWRQRTSPRIFIK